MDCATGVPIAPKETAALSQISETTAAATGGKPRLTSSGAASAAGVPKPTLFRPVGGAANEAQLAFLAGKGYHSIYWNVDTRDWDGHPKTSQKGTEEYEAFVNGRVDLIMAQVKDGDIILMHDI